MSWGEETTNWNYGLKWLNFVKFKAFGIIESIPERPGGLREQDGVAVSVVVKVIIASGFKPIDAAWWAADPSSGAVIEGIENRFDFIFVFQSFFENFELKKTYRA